MLRTLLVLTVVLLQGCQTWQSTPTPPPVAQPSVAQAIMTMEQAVDRVDQQALTPAQPPQTRPAVIDQGTGVFVNKTRQRGVQASSRQGKVTLNFENTEISELVKVVFDILKQNYVIDPQVKGMVTMKTGSPLPKDQLLPALEMTLNMYNAALIREGNVYRIVPRDQAMSSVGSAQLAQGNLPAGYQVEVVPLKYIAAKEMAQILEPLVPKGTIVRVDTPRQLLMLAGSAWELANARETINIFDVNWLKGMSVGFYPLRNVDSTRMVEELDALFGPKSELPLAGLIRFVPLEQVNAIIAITPQVDYLREISSWIKRLDEATGGQLYVYSVQNGNAENLATMLSGVFNVSSQATGGQPNADLAPGKTPVNLSNSQRTNKPATLQSPANLSRQSNRGQNNATRIIADRTNNNLLIWSDQDTYAKITEALRRLDIRPRQVLVEVTIAEVTLNGKLEYGLQWFLNEEVKGFNGNATLGLGQTTTSGLLSPAAAAANGFSFVLGNSEGLARLLLKAMDTEGSVNVLSSPQILVLDNHAAEINVGDEVPVETGSSVTDGGTTTTSISFKKTGVQLKVTPQINTGGLITMKVDQAVTDAGDIDQATNQRAFFERTISSKVAIQSGQTVILGGLIKDNDTSSRSGIPVLREVPVIGGLFGGSSRINNRTELLIMITPRIVRDAAEAQQITQEMRQRMRAVTPLIDQNIGRRY